MNTVKALLHYQSISYIKSNKFVMPLVVWVTYLFFLYAQMPNNIIDSYTISMAGLFYIMTWLGLTYTDIEDSVSEQLLILKVHSEIKYYMSRIVFLGILTVFISIITVIFPIVKGVFVGFRLYPIRDLIQAIVLHSFAGFTGSMTGALFHPRIVKNRKQAITLTVLVALMGIVKSSINQIIPFTSWITWVFPPITNFIKILKGASFYDIHQVMIILVLLGGYSFLLVVAQTYWLIRNKF